MKKIVIPQDIHSVLQKKNSFLNRSDMRVFAAASNDEALQVHRTVHADLIVTKLDMTGMSTEQLCATIRAEAPERPVSIMLACENSQQALSQCERLGADAVVLQPIKHGQLLEKARKLLRISWRETYRVLLNVSVEGNDCDRHFSCHSLDISPSGMLLETDQAFVPEARIDCVFYLPDTTRIQATGQIVRSLQPPSGVDANWYGVHFLEINPEAQLALDAFVKRTSRRKTGTPPVT